MSGDSTELAQIYEQRSQQTLRIWREPLKQAPHHGFYPPNLLAIATGIQPVVPQPVLELLAALRRVTRDDPLADVMQPANFHLTFLALTPALYDRPPSATDELKTLTEAHCLTKTLNVRQLRLVALPNQLLLAGIPDRASIRLRAALWQDLQSSGWGDLLRQRYGGSQQPPLFWHSTLLRYDANILPDYLQRFFTERASRRYGEIGGEIRLRLVSYNWSQAVPLARSLAV